MMEVLWAPWRGQYIRDVARGRETSCFLCRGLADDRDAENLLVYRGAASAVFLNRYPYNNGHLLVCPTEHRGTLGELEGAALLEPLQTLRWMTRLLDRIFRPDGYNVGLNQGEAAGAGLPGHLHWHLVPRWDGDTNFLPVLGGAKVIVESLSEFYARLVHEIARDGRTEADPRDVGVLGGPGICS